MTYLTASDLRAIGESLTKKDRNILITLGRLRYAKSDQLQRLFYPKTEDHPYASARATNRNLTRLKELHLIDHLPQRIGGIRAGSSGMVWFLTEQGNRFLALGTGDEKKRKRFLEPSPMFLRHTIAVTETFVQIVDICRMEPEMRLFALDAEPNCWRSYYRNGKEISLRPDLYVKTVTGKYYDHAFIEMDLATESLSFILDKCRRYHEYYQTGAEKVFPLVLWIVPDGDRKEKIITAMREVFRKSAPRLFHVITPEALHRVLKEGAPENEMH